MRGENFLTMTWDRGMVTSVMMRSVCSVVADTGFIRSVEREGGRCDHTIDDRARDGSGSDESVRQEEAQPALAERAAEIGARRLRQGEAGGIISC
jgi:hypothetical protein